MLSNDLNKQWKIDFFKIFSTNPDNPTELEKADKLKFEHFPPVIGNFYRQVLDEKTLRKICQGKIELRKSKLAEGYNDKILKINYEKTIKTQLNKMMNQQIAQLHHEDPNFLTEEEKEIIESSDFPFIKLMTLVYTKDTDEMTPEDQVLWKENMNSFINQQITFGVINTYYTMNLYKDNNYVRIFQTPYNKEEVWDKYADNKKGFCVAYDFKEIKDIVVKNLNKIYPVLYVEEELSENDLDFDVYNIHSASLTRIEENVTEWDNEWMFIHNHHYTETEYTMLDNLLEPVYTKSTNDDRVQKIIKTNYLVTENDELIYNYRDIINDLLQVIESQEFKQKISKEFDEVLKITEDKMEIDFMKPEAIYLGTDFPEEDILPYKEIIESEGVRIFKIKQKDDKIFKALI